MLGMVLVFTLGKWLTWRWLAGVSCVFPILSMILLPAVPESPSWLVTQGRCKEAKKALTWLRGDDYDITEEYKKLETSYKITQSKKVPEEINTWGTVVIKTKDFVVKLGRPDVWKPVLLMLLLTLLQQFAGVATISYYAITIFGDGKRLDKYSATIIYGFIRYQNCLIIC